jgi:VanZ family protein
MRKRIVWWIMTVLWCAAIFYQSGKNADASDANSLYIVGLINQILMTMFGADAGVISNFIVRKSAHFLEYLILGILFFKSFFTGMNLRRELTVAFFCGLAYSASDEIHQLFVPGRTSKFGDVCIDATGVVIGLIIVALNEFLKSRDKRSRKKKADSSPVK